MERNRNGGCWKKREGNKGSVRRKGRKSKSEGGKGRVAEDERKVQERKYRELE